jgi:hypothetical protein
MASCVTPPGGTRIALPLCMSKHNASPSAVPPLRLDDIEMFPGKVYEVDVAWTALERTIAHHVDDEGLDLSPDFQRGHVWTLEQRSAYVEYILRGGEGGKLLSFNRSGWLGSGPDGPYQIIDGLQRLTTAQMFMRDEVPAFGRLLSKFVGRLRMHVGFKWRIYELPTRADVLRYYLQLNAGGTPHPAEEIARVRGLLEAETPSTGRL